MTISNEAANVANKLISGVMASSESDGARQSALVIYMYENEVTYSLDEVTKFFTVTGADRTKLIAQALANISDDYDNVSALINTMTAKRKASKESFSDKEALQLETLNAKVRAANMLFIRALTGVFHLRVAKATKVKPSTVKGTISYIGTDKEGDAVKTSLSGNALVRLGQKDIDTAFPSKRKTTNTVTNNPVKGGIAPTADVVANRVRIQVANGKGIEDMGDDEEAALEKLLHELLAAKFLDDKGNVDVKTVVEYVKAEFPAKVSAPKADKAA